MYIRIWIADGGEKYGRLPMTRLVVWIYSKIQGKERNISMQGKVWDGEPQNGWCISDMGIPIKTSNRMR